MYEVTEICPYCRNEIKLSWDVETYGYYFYCPFCGTFSKIKSITGDYDSRTDTCRFNRKTEVSE